MGTANWIAPQALSDTGIRRGVLEELAVKTLFLGGEMSLVDESPPSATVTVVQPTQILAIDKQLLVARLDSDAAFAARFYRAIATFLSIRMRNTVQRFGYGNAPVATEEELDIALLDTVHIAGARFDRMIKELLGA